MNEELKGLTLDPVKTEKQEMLNTELDSEKLENTVKDIRENTTSGLITKAERQDLEIILSMLKKHNNISFPNMVLLTIMKTMDVPSCISAVFALQEYVKRKMTRELAQMFMETLKK